MPESLEQAIEHDFVLYVVRGAPRSESALRTLRRACEDHLPGRYRITVVDVALEQAAAEEARIVATPTLIRKRPRPAVRIVGDLSNERDLVANLGLTQEDHP